MINAVPKIKLTNVHKKFGKKIVLDGVHLEVLPGESLVIIGGSGSGKSVSIKTVLGLITPDSGTVEVDGVDVTRMNFRERAPMLSTYTYPKYNYQRPPELDAAGARRPTPPRAPARPTRPWPRTSSTSSSWIWACPGCTGWRCCASCVPAARRCRC